MFTLSPIAESIVTSILQRKLRPVSASAKELAELFDVSRTLVREALKQLQTRGFVDVRPRIGWYVVEPSFEDARQIYRRAASSDRHVARRGQSHCSR